MNANELYEKIKSNILCELKIKEERIIFENKSQKMEIAIFDNNDCDWIDTDQFVSLAYNEKESGFAYPYTMNELNELVADINDVLSDKFKIKSIQTSLF